MHPFFSAVNCLFQVKVTLCNHVNNKKTAKPAFSAVQRFFHHPHITKLLLLPVGLHQRPDLQPQRVDLDEALGVGLVKDLVLLEGGKVQVEERI